MSSEMQQTMNKISVNFTQQRFAVFLGLTFGNFGSDDNLSVVEGDDVSRRLDVHEVAMHAFTGGVIDEGDLEMSEVMQRGVVSGGSLQYLFDTPVGDLLESCQPSLGNIHLLLLISKNNLKMHGWILSQACWDVRCLSRDLWPVSDHFFFGFSLLFMSVMRLLAD